MREELPLGWAQTTLGDIGEYVNGRAFKESDWSERGRIIIRIQDLTGSGKQPNRFEGPIEERHTVRRGDFLISWAATLGAYLWAGDEAVLNQHIFKVNSHIDRRFHYYLVQTLLADLLRQSHGSGMVHITKSRFESTLASIPPLAEQCRIVAAIEEHLSRLDAAVAGLKRVLLQLPRYRAAVLKAAVEGGLEPKGTGRSEEDGLPTGWRWETVAALAERVDYGTSAKTAEAGDIPVLRMGNIREGTLVFDSLKYLPAGQAEFPNLLLRAGDVLFNRTNSAELVGKSAVYSGHPSPCSFASYLIRVRLRPDCLPEFFAAVLNSVYGRRWIGEVVSQQVGQANVSGGKLKNFRIPLPPQNVQGHIVAEMERCFSLAVAVEGQVASGLMRAQRLRQSILHRAFSGKLVPQDPNDEPAGVLLERVRAARVAAPIKPRRRRKVGAR